MSINYESFFGRATPKVFTLDDFEANIEFHEEKCLDMKDMSIFSPIILEDVEFIGKPKMLTQLNATLNDDKSSDDNDSLANYAFDDQSLFDDEKMEISSDEEESLISAKKTTKV